jgi:hypothetical protein
MATVQPEPWFRALITTTTTTNNNNIKHAHVKHEFPNTLNLFWPSKVWVS